MSQPRSFLASRCALFWQAVLRAVRFLRKHTWPFIRRHPKESTIGLALLLMLLGPFLLRPAERTTPSRYDRRLVIMTPHYEAIRQEFGQAFARWWKEKKGETLSIDWRVQGASELATMVKSDFTSAFQRHWQHDLKHRWSSEVGAAFMDARTPATDLARSAFLDSNVSIGVDVMFGGNPFDFQTYANAGLLVSSDGGTGAGLKRIRARHPDWFGENAIPDAVSNERYVARDMTWSGTCLSSFGIVFNRDVLKRLGVGKEPAQWTDLADPRLFGQVALADPSKSASVAKAFEMIIQQQMHQAIAELKKKADPIKRAEEIESQGVKEGWNRGLALIQKISANARFFTDAAPKIALEVASGDAAAGMCIDFYGRSAQDESRRADGTSRVGFIAPEGGTAVSADPIGMFRGAPEPELAEAFIEFVLSPEGQKLWNYRAGAPGGPESVPLRRLPIRKDLYAEANRAFMTDGDERPFEKAEAFVYRPDWTGSMFNSLRFIVRVMCVDSHTELRDTWRTMIAKGMSAQDMMRLPNLRQDRADDLPRSVEVLHGLQSVAYDFGRSELASLLGAGGDKVKQVREARRLTEGFRRQYEKAAFAAGK